MVTFDVSVEKIAHLKACDSQRLWLVLINQTSREVQLQEFRQNLDKIEQQFTKLLDVGGVHTFSCYVIGGDGEITTSGNKVFNVNG